MFIGTINAVGNIPEVYFDRAATAEASTLTNYRLIVLPAIVPELRASLLLSFGLAWSLVVAGVLLGAQEGLGVIVTYALQFAYTGRVMIVTFLFILYAGISFAIVDANIAMDDHLATLGHDSCCRNRSAEICDIYALRTTRGGAWRCCGRGGCFRFWQAPFLNEALWTYCWVGLSSAVLVGLFSFRDGLYGLTGAVCLKISTDSRLADRPGRQRNGAVVALHAAARGAAVLGDWRSTSLLA